MQYTNYKVKAWPLYSKLLIGSAGSDRNECEELGVKQIRNHLVSCATIFQQPLWSLQNYKVSGSQRLCLGGGILKTNDAHLNKNNMLKWYEIHEDNLFWIGFIDR